MPTLGIYEVKTTDDEVFIDGATLEEIAGVLHMSVGTIRNAVYQEYALQGRYKIQKVDEMIGKTRDAKTLRQYDSARKKILSYIKQAAARKERYEINSKK